MPKITLDDVLSGSNLSKINDNFTKIETALNDQVLYRDNPVGQVNSLETDLDINGKHIYNLAVPVDPSDPARLQDVLDAIGGNLVAGPAGPQGSQGDAGLAGPVGPAGSIGTVDTSQVSENTNLYFTEPRVLATVLTGFSTATSTAIAATDTVLIGMGKAQAELDLKAPIASPTFTGTVDGITATMVGLSAVDNTSDLGKPVSTLTQTAINLKANVSGNAAQIFSAITAVADTNTTQVATTAYVIGQASSNTPPMDGSAAVGSSLKYARENHVHPSDTTKLSTGAVTSSGLTMNTAKVLGRATASSGAVEEIAVTGTGSVVLTTSPTLTTPNIGTATGTASGNALLAGSSSQNFAANALTTAGKITATGNIVTDAFGAGAGKGLFFRDGFEVTSQPGVTVFDLISIGYSADVRVNGVWGGGLYANDIQALKWLTTGITIPGTLAVSTAGSSIAIEAVTAPTLLNSWVNFGSGYLVAGYWKDPFGVVHLQGGITGGTASSVIFTLPTGYRPTFAIGFMVNTAGVVGVVTIQSNGDVGIVGSSTGLTDINGITFRTT